MIEQVDKHGKVVARYKSTYDAQRKTGIHQTNISRAVRGKRGSAGGYKWQEVDDVSNYEDTSYQQDLDNGTLQVDTYYDHPPHPDQVIADHNIDTKKWKLSNFYSKAKTKGWLVTAQFLNLSQTDTSLDLDSLERIIKKNIVPLKRPVPHLVKNEKALRIIIADAHIGMDVSGGMYAREWNREELFRRGDKILQEAIYRSTLYGGFDRVDIIDLGDYLDGLDGQTVRRTHDLPQNMTNEEAFDAALAFKLSLVNNICQSVKHNKLNLYNVCVDNHAGRFAYFVNSAVKQVIEAQYGGVVKVFNLMDFMSHYEYGNNLFVLSHGKDGKDLKTGMPARLDNKTKDKIDEYLKHHGLYKKGRVVTFEKGDSHQQIIDQTSSMDFNYHSYMALSPASAWVTLNFTKGRSGYNLMIVDKNTGEQDIIPRYFD
jgi:hypothetical protein